ncbi:MAG: (deoxy)nucleoside triphosphate pyrophosphohydrolase [Bacteroidales bacterium]|nr:(deoxy)nucleoside triphosphate pyrophosphohydrolase [Bacteroidales bacterium]MBN2634231.1 (deoxy)nucleoside triphosphate pyrophosphohydrolase [Bacteroidales bacterium]
MIRVTCAIIRNEDQEVLVVQRDEKSDHPFKWEFPGGKINDGETEEECIVREIREELSIDIVICGRMEEVDHDYGKKHIVLIPFICDTLDELPLLFEHNAFRWMLPSGLRELDLLDADVIVAEKYLEQTGIHELSGTYNKPPDFDPDADSAFLEVIGSTMRTREIEYIATSASEDPWLFSKLIDYSLSDDGKIGFHASWILTKVADKNPVLFYDKIPLMVDSLDKIINESVLRSYLRIITKVDMAKMGSSYQGILTDHCFSFLKSRVSSVAVKAYSMEIIYRLALIYPELAQELSATINMLRGETSAGIVARGRIILKQLAALKKLR